MTFHICVVWENGCRALTEQMLTPEKSIPKRKPKKNVMDNKIQNLRRLHRTSKNKRKNKRTHEKRKLRIFDIFRIQLCSAYEHEGKCAKDLSKGLMTHSFNSAAYRAEISHKHGKVWEQIWKFRTSMFEHSHIWWQVGKALLDLSIVSCDFDTRFLFVTKLWLIVRVKGNGRCKSPGSLIQRKYYFWAGF